MADIIPFPAATAAHTQTKVIDTSADADRLLQGRDGILKVSNQLEAILSELRLVLGRDRVDQPDTIDNACA